MPFSTSVAPAVDISRKEKPSFIIYFAAFTKSFFSLVSPVVVVVGLGFI